MKISILNLKVQTTGKNTLMQNKRYAQPRGSIFILCMWVLLFLGIFSISVGYSVRQRIKLVERLENRQKLRRIAESGVQKVMYLLKYDRNDFDALTERWSQNPAGFEDVKLGEGSFSIVSETGDEIRYGIVDEESKINLNLVKSPIVFKRLFHDGLGLDEALSSQLAEAILDWRDEDHDAYASGAENSFYQGLIPPYRAKNADFTVLEELRFVKGVTKEIYQKIQPYLSVDSLGKINLNTASTPVLRAMGFSDSLAAKIMIYRAGLDRTPGTDDDNVLSDTETIVAAIDQFTSLTDEEKSSLQDFIGSGLFTIRSSYFRVVIRSQIPSRPMTLTTISVLERSEREVKVLSWRESYRSA